jgi:predicted neutral ceramidase superfamily lipid hydrolase
MTSERETMKRLNLSRLFYIYSELYIAVFCLFIAAIELVCGLSLLALGEKFVAYIALASVIFFATVAVLYFVEVYFLEKGNS